MNDELRTQTSIYTMKIKFPRMTWFCVLGCTLSMQACSLPQAATPTQGAKQVGTPAQVTTAVSPSKLPELFLPKNLFKSPEKAIKTTSPQTPLPAPVVVAGRTPPLKTMVWLYASPSTQALMETGGIDFKVQLRVWESFLRKYRIPFKTINTVDLLESSAPGVLVLPSLVALSEREKLAVSKFRSQGGGVLATWLTGVRDAKGAWQGFSFMENVLDTRVLGDTAIDEESNFLMPHGDGPITHNLPAGQRIWLERVPDMYPLRLLGQQSAASIMDWSRNSVQGKTLSSMVFAEKAQSTGALSRSVVLGYPERLWMSTDPKMMDAIAHNALRWLLRYPVVYLAAWPYPFTNAISMAVQAPEIVDDVDVKFSHWFEGVGARATYYVVTEILPKSTDALKKLQAKGHEIGYLSDHFEGFKGQPENTQSKRLMTMQQQMKEASLLVGADSGFSAPMDSFDKTTVALLNQLRLGHYLAGNDGTDGRLPVRSVGTNESSLVMLPRTISGPEDLMNEGDPDEGLQQFLAELDLAQSMGSLSIVRFPNQSLLADDQLKPIFDQLRNSKKTSWLALNSQVAHWWRERSRVAAVLEMSSGTAKLSVTIDGTAPMNRPASVVVNLPEANSSLRLLADGHTYKLSTSTVLDPWRVAVSLEGLPPGSYRWLMQFDPAVASSSK